MSDDVPTPPAHVPAVNADPRRLKGLLIPTSPTPVFNVPNPAIPRVLGLVGTNILLVNGLSAYCGPIARESTAKKPGRFFLSGITKICGQLLPARVAVMVWLAEPKPSAM